MRKTVLVVAALLLAFAASQVCAVELLTNGDFEQSTEPNGFLPGWSGDISWNVVGPTPWFWGVAPISGNQFIGMACQGDNTGGLLGNWNANVASGDYLLNITGWSWVLGVSNDGYQSEQRVKLWIDDKPIRYRMYRTDYTPCETWLPTTMQWRGHINNKVSIELWGQARGRVLYKGLTWGQVCCDKWSIDATQNPPTPSNLLVNGGFEQGTANTGNAGPGWITSGLPNVKTWGWKSYPMPDGVIDANPYEGNNALSIGETGAGTGTAQQTVSLAPGNYTLYFKGHVVLYDNDGNDGVTPSCTVHYLVDGYPVKDITLLPEKVGNQPGGTGTNYYDSWYEVTYRYSGQVNSDVGVWVSGTTPASNDDVLIDDFSIVSGDATPPTTPVVADEGAYTESLSQLKGYWTSSDPESGIIEYDYAIGSAPGLSDVAGFISAGTSTSGTRAGLSLQPGHTYYISVKARNGSGLWSAVGSSDGITVVGSVSINVAKSLPDGAPVKLDRKYCTYNKGFQEPDSQWHGIVSGTDIWIEELDRSSAIHVAVSSQLDPGGTGTIQGVMGTVNGQRTVLQASAAHMSWAPGIPNNPPTLAVKPVALANKAVGGGWFGQFTPGVDGGVGPNNVGLFVTVTGAPTQQDPGGTYFYIDDGSGLRDGTKTNGADNMGIRIIGPPQYYPFVPSSLAVEGLVTVFQANGKYHPAIQSIPTPDGFSIIATPYYPF